MKNRKSLNIIRWTARITGTLLALFCLTFFIGYLFEGSNKSGPVLHPFNILIFVVWGTGLASYVLAWWKEGLGGIISFVSLILFNILAAVNPVEGSSYSFVLLIFLIPSILFLLYWRFNREAIKSNLK